MTCQNGGKNGVGTLVFLGVALFSSIYMVSFQFAPSLSSMRVAFVLLVAWFFLMKRCRIIIDFTTLMMLFTLILLCSFSVSVSVINNSDYIQSSRIFHFILFCFILPYIVVEIIQEERDFHLIIIACGLIQSFMVFVTFFNVDFSRWLFSVIVAASSFDINIVSRSPGFSSQGGSALSVALSLSMISLFRLSVCNSKFWHYMAAITIILATLLVGRMGFLISLTMFLSMLILRRKGWLHVLVLLPVLALLYNLSTGFLGENKQLTEYTLNWALSIFTGDDQTVAILINMGVPNLSTEALFFGTGAVAMSNGENASGSDVGYIQSYYALGLVFSPILYMCIFLLLLKNVLLVSAKNKSFAYFLLFLPFILEFKEPFIFKYALVFYVHVSLLYLKKSQKVAHV